MGQRLAVTALVLGAAFSALWLFYSVGVVALEVDSSFGPQGASFLIVPHALLGILVATASVAPAHGGSPLRQSALAGVLVALFLAAFLATARVIQDMPGRPGFHALAGVLVGVVAFLALGADRLVDRLDPPVLTRAVDAALIVGAVAFVALILAQLQLVYTGTIFGGPKESLGAVSELVERGRGRPLGAWGETAAHVVPFGVFAVLRRRVSDLPRLATACVAATAALALMHYGLMYRLVSRFYYLREGVAVDRLLHASELCLVAGVLPLAARLAQAIDKKLGAPAS